MAVKQEKKAINQRTCGVATDGRGHRRPPENRAKESFREERVCGERVQREIDSLTSL